MVPHGREIVCVCASGIAAVLRRLVKAAVFDLQAALLRRSKLPVQK
jgi:hypothetical protein